MGGAKPVRFGFQAGVVCVAAFKSGLTTCVDCPLVLIKRAALAALIFRK